MIKLSPKFRCLRLNQTWSDPAQVKEKFNKGFGQNITGHFNLEVWSNFICFNTSSQLLPKKHIQPDVLILGGFLWALGFIIFLLTTTFSISIVTVKVKLKDPYFKKLHILGRHQIVRKYNQRSIIILNFDNTLIPFD